LAIPLASAQVAQAATGFVDTVMMGWLGQQTLAAGGLAATTFTTLLVTATGIVVGVSPLVAEAYGANNNRKIQQFTGQGLWLSLLVAIPIMFLLGHMDVLMTKLGQAEAIATLAKTYLDVMVWGFFPALTFAMLKSVVSSLSQPRAITVIVIAGTLFNAFGNYVLGFGKLGFPALGLAGIAWASNMSQWLMLLCMVVYITRHGQIKTYRLFQNLVKFEPRIFREMIWVGFPISISFALEVGLFTVTTYLMGIVGTEVLAAHQIVFQTIAVIFMVPLGMSLGTTIRVAQWNGQQNIEGVKRATYVNMFLAATFMTVMAIALLVFPRQVISLYLDVNNPDNGRAISLVSSMSIVAALSQILDGVQTTAAGALRGLKDTRIPMLLSFIAFWAIGLTSGYWLGFYFGFGGIGLWLGQLIGVAASAGVFVWRFQILMSRSFKE
jgi:MATE family multidrug resistance protein